MGVIKPGWVSQEWFDSCPFNYCDHFGDKEFLATVCKICRMEKQENLLGENFPSNSPVDEKDPDIYLDPTIQPERVSQFGEDVQDILYGEEVLAPAVYRLLGLLKRYDNQVAKMIFFFQSYHIIEGELMTKAIEVLSHSRHYCYIKIDRAWSSLLEEQRSEVLKELADSKTSALFAYIALERNSRAFLAVAREYPNAPLYEETIELSDISWGLMEIIKRIFFSEDLSYTELGCEEYDRCFSRIKKGSSKSKQ